MPVRKTRSLLNCCVWDEVALILQKNLIGAAANPPTPLDPAALQWCTCFWWPPMVACGADGCVTQNLGTAHLRNGSQTLVLASRKFSGISVSVSDWLDFLRPL